MNRGNIQRRGKHSWRIRFEDGVDAAGRRKRHTITFRGTRQQAQKELTKRLSASDAGTLVEPSKATVAQYLRAWLGTGVDGDDGSHDLAPKTVERYRDLVSGQIAPHLGGRPLQQLRPDEIEAWHATTY